jgi:hypothetical protein
LSLQVFRSYDSRVRPTDRSEAIYTDPVCRSIVGEGVEMVVKLDGMATDALSENRTDFKLTLRTNFWAVPGELKVIATPYRPGVHVATKPRNFVPIIDQLVALHGMDYVHGDIRAFNTVFNDQNADEGWLIDFDYGGKVGEKKYPRGYRTSLDDGTRTGKEKTLIEKWHDWYALGKLIFSVHTFFSPNETTKSDEFLHIKEYWANEIDNKVPDESKIKELKAILVKIDKQGWLVKPSPTFQMVLGVLREKPEGNTKAEATGSPPQK